MYLIEVDSNLTEVRIKYENTNYELRIINSVLYLYSLFVIGKLVWLYSYFVEIIRNW